MISRTSFSECASTGKIRASGSLKTEAASVNCTRCFLKFDFASRLSHSNAGAIGAIYRIPEVGKLVLWRGLYPSAAQRIACKSLRNW